MQILKVRQDKHEGRAEHKLNDKENVQARTKIRTLRIQIAIISA